MRFVVTLSLLLSACAHQAATGQANISEESYDFLAVTDGPCIPQIAVGIDPKHRAKCSRMTEPRRYRGIWRVEFEASVLTPIGQPRCLQEKGGDCAWIEGKDLPWPGRWDCSREYEIEFIGRRNALPGSYGHGGSSHYKVVVDRLISAKRRPDPYDANCDPELHSELKTKK